MTADAKPRNPKLVARDARCADWIVELVVQSPTPGRLPAARMDAQTGHPCWRKAFTRTGIAAALAVVQDGPDPVLVRDADGAYVMPTVLALAAAGML